MRIQSTTLRTTLFKPSTSTRLAPAARTTFFASTSTLRSRASITPTSNDTQQRILGRQSLFHSQSRNMASATSFYDFKPLDKKGNPVPLSTYANKVVLVVNTASKCGFTPQYEGLEKIYKSINAAHPDSFVILGFPCNQFGGQEPGSDDTIQEFCQLNYGVSFPIMGKTDVNGDKANPLFEWLKEEKPGLLGMKRVKWNFEKWLVGKDGKVKGRWASTTKPESLEKAILEEITKGEGKAGL
ncbi:thioredoxin-like protein [Cadophora sp. MPI-SDFR-AT-0126]|nr:thioredoxin-like protein [Leotiomycetes sp. MPI-SDFR-AT-0126]